HRRVHAEHEGRTVEVIELGSQVALGRFDVDEPALTQQAAHRVGKVELGGQCTHRAGIRRRGKDPARPGTRSRGGNTHARKVRATSDSDKHQTAAYSSTPHPSHTSTDRPAAITLRRWSGMAVLQRPHAEPRSAYSALEFSRPRMRSYFWSNGRSTRDAVWFRWARAVAISASSVARAVAMSARSSPCRALISASDSSSRSAVELRSAMRVASVCISLSSWARTRRVISICDM